MTILSSCLDIDSVRKYPPVRLSLFTGLDYWTGILDWTTGLKFFPFLDKIMWFFKYLTPGDLNYFFR